MVSDVLHALRRSERIDKVIVVTGENGAEALARAYDAESIADDDRGHSHAARAGVDWALEREYDRVLLVPGDCPALDPGGLIFNTMIHGNTDHLDRIYDVCDIIGINYYYSQAPGPISLIAGPSWRGISGCGWSACRPTPRN